MDEARYDAILKRIGKLAVYPDVPPIPYKEYAEIQNPMLTLEEFFEGNDDGGSIWCNLQEAPEPDEVYTMLKAIRSRPEVDAVYIMVTQHDGPGSWPFSDTVWVVTSTDPDAVVEWLPEGFRPDDCWEGVPDHFNVEAVPVPEGKKLVALWYD
jgi:hypothetical protein